MDLVELTGWLAAACTLGVYLMRTMLPLRVMGVLANLLFAAYGYLEDIPPTLYLHLALLPVNLSRLIELLRTVKKVQNAATDPRPLDWLADIESVRLFEAGKTVFQAGEEADKLYYLKSGTVHFPEISREACAGEVFGEVAFFTDDRKRTASAECLTRCEIIEVDEKTLMRAYYQTPAFGMFLTRIIARRLSDLAVHAGENVKQHQ